MGCDDSDGPGHAPRYLYVSPKMYILHSIIAFVLLFSVLYQAWGRGESQLLWGLIYVLIASVLCFIPSYYIGAVALFLWHVLLIKCMKPWNRKTVVIIDNKGGDPAKIKKDFENIVGKEDTEDVVVYDVSRELFDPINIKNYTDISQQEELWNDLKVLKDNKVRYRVQNGIITSLFVDAQEAKVASDLLGIVVPVLEQSSNN